VHAGEVDDEATLSGDGTAGEAGAAAARDDGNAEAGGDFDGGGDFFGGEGGDYGIGLAEGPGAIVGVDGEVFGGGLEAVGGEGGAQAVDQWGVGLGLAELGEHGDIVLHVRGWWMGRF
jgi:hypothetical protein